MRIVVGKHDDGNIRLEDPTNLRGFSVETSGNADAAGEVLEVETAGRRAEKNGHVWVDVDAVRRLAAGRVPADWDARFDDLIAFASTRGWMSPDGGSILAHVEVGEAAAGTVPLIELNSGHSIPQLGYGVFRVPPDETESLVTEALELGYRHLDTAAAYRNESGVGRAIRNSGLRRDEIFVTTKVFNDQQGKERTPAAFDASLQALGLDYVDLYLIHWPAPRLDLYVETWQVLEGFARDGRSRSIGVSNFLQHHLERLLAQAEIVPAVNQIELHPILQQAGVVEFCRERGIAVEAWSPLGAGQLPLFAQPAVTEAAAAHDRTPAQIVLRWHIQRGTIVFPKSSDPQRMRENLSIFDFLLTPEEMAAISGLERGGRVGFHPDEWH